MSFVVTVRQLVKSGTLQPFRTSQGSSRRALFLTPEVINEINGNASNLNFHRAKPYVIAAFEHWVTGGRMNIRMGGKGRGAALALLDPPPPGVWEMRITDPTPQFRIFGMFGRIDTIVTFGIENRSVLGDMHRSSKKSRSAEWQRAMKVTRERWDKYFPEDEPVIESDPEAYISDNYHVI